jgi:hypothetical protein
VSPAAPYHFFANLKGKKTRNKKREIEIAHTHTHKREREFIRNGTE